MLQLILFNMRRYLLGTKYRQGQRVWPADKAKRQQSLKLYAYKGPRVNVLDSGKCIIEEEWIAEGVFKDQPLDDKRNLWIISVGKTWEPMPKIQWQHQ